MIKLIATDMDGTFLRGDMTYDEVKFAGLHDKMDEEKIQFVVASGNQYYQLQSFFTKYSNIIYLAENGAYIRTPEKELIVHRFESDQVKKILEQLGTVQNIKMLVCGRKSAYALNTVDPDHVEHMRNYYHHLEVIDSYDQIEDDILKFAIACPPELTDSIVNELAAKLHGLAVPTSSGHGDIDIIQPGINKAAGLRELGVLLDTQLDEMVAFGDGGNDLEMIREVGVGVAMANAQANVKQVSDAQTGDNESQGVLSYLETKVL